MSIATYNSSTDVLPEKWVNEPILLSFWRQALTSSIVSLECVPIHLRNGVNVYFRDRKNGLPSGLPLAMLLLYFPIGICLAILRLFIGFHAYLVACLLPKMTTIRSIVLRSMCGVLGILVSSEGVRDKKTKVMVANYTTTLDHLAIDLIYPNILPSVWDLPPALMWILGYTDMGAKNGRGKLIQTAKTHCHESTLPILAFPEGASTSGKVGLLKFSVWPFCLDQPVQPVVVKVYRPPICKIAPSILGGRWWIDIFWFLFVPYTSFHIKLLPSVSEEEEETVEEFTKRVEELITSVINIQPTHFTSADKVEYAKKKLFLPPEPGVRDHVISGGQEEDWMEVMTRQVQEVLPHVPCKTIRTDLALTKDVDLTITNILEGRVQSEPAEELPSSSTNTDKLSTSCQQDSPIPKLSSDFGKTSEERHLSLEERKKKLVENLRRRYTEKHGLT